MAIIVDDVTGLRHSPQSITFTSSCREYESISSVDKIVPKYCNISKILGRGIIETPLSPLFRGINARVRLRLNGLRKTFGIKIMIVYPRLPLEWFISRFCIFLKLRCVQKLRGFKLHLT